jgi:hypothetical protein
MEEHKDELEMIAEMDAVFGAAKREAIEKGLEIHIVMSLVWPCGCILTRDTGTVVRDNKVH